MRAFAAKAGLVLLAASLASGCYRTHYVNFSGARPELGGPAEPAGVERVALQGAEPDPPPAPAPTRVSGWQSFFVYGWGPAERRIDAVARCRTPQNIDSIRTQQKFVQGRSSEHSPATTSTSTRRGMAPSTAWRLRIGSSR